MKVLTRDTWIGIVMLIAAAVYWFEASKIRASPLDDGIGAAGLPKALAFALGALAIVLIVRSILSALMFGAPAEKAEPEIPTAALWRPHLRAVGMLAIGVGYLLLVSWLGYIITVALLLLCVSLYIGAPLSTRTLLVAGIGGIAYHFLFVEFLGIPLPAGAILGPLLNG
jgi:hypothetical protein